MDINPHYKGGVQNADLSAPDADPRRPDDPAELPLYRHRVSYLYEEQPRQQELEHEHEHMPPELAALRLMEIHYGDGENKLLMPSADASPQEIMDQAQLMGITAIQIQSQGRVINDVSE